VIGNEPVEGGAEAGQAARSQIGNGGGDDGCSYGGLARARRAERRRRRWGQIEFFFMCGRGTVWHVGREGVGAGAKSLQTLVTTQYICRLTDEFNGLSSSVQATFLDAGTEAYNLVIFLDTAEYKVTEECILVSCSVVT
jgi:hypothetical protein